jgi:glycosyltransferase involved in cell wall biosynthesis
MKRFPHIYDESSAEDYKRFPFNIYWRGYMSLQELVAIDEDFADTICANSRFTANAVKGIWNRDAIVVYPPVAVNDFSHGQKQKMVVSLGRIDPDKRLEDLIKALALCATKPKLVIVGGLVSNYVPYVVRLQNLIKQLNLERRVSIKPNASFDVVKKILSSAKVYVHAKHFEHFGISVVEAMASGCVPIVHRSGGPYLDIIENDKYGFSYATISELSQKIDSLMSSDTSALEERCVCRSKHFSEDKFRERIVEVIGD